METCPQAMHEFTQFILNVFPELTSQNGVRVLTSHPLPSAEDLKSFPLVLMHIKQPYSNKAGVYSLGTKRGGPYWNLTNRNSGFSKYAVSVAKHFGLIIPLIFHSP